MSLDLDILEWLSQHRTPSLTTVARSAMHLGTSTIVIGAVGVVGLVLVVAKRWWWQTVTIAVSVVAALTTAVALKHLVQRARPPEALAIVPSGGFSMPSTVAALTAAVAVAAYLVFPWPSRYRRGLAIPLAVFVVLVGGAMVYLGAHWPSDVVAGWAVGAGISGAVASLARVAVRRWNWRLPRSVSEPENSRA
ncbi:phosphatase PAP2 family protein [Nocardia sp. NPDC051832]|uniref:phosphatase PAP2 family protein n=1 Tax=Nocardia sp. NPDC051832 TaxID=3155673 RepID=UPI0034201F2D